MYLRFFLCIFENDTVKVIVLGNDEIFKDLIQTVGNYFTSFTVCSVIKNQNLQ